MSLKATPLSRRSQTDAFSSARSAVLRRVFFFQLLPFTGVESGGVVRALQLCLLERLVRTALVTLPVQQDEVRLPEAHCRSVSTNEPSAAEYRCSTCARS